MNCEELQQNSAAYSLGALTDAERAEFERHMAECDLEHEVEEFDEVVSRLSEAAPAIDPPAGLRDRILSAAAADVTAPEVTGDVPARQVDGWLSRLQRFGAPAYGAAAVMLIVVGALIGWGVTALSTGSDTELSHFRRDPGGEWFRVETVLGEDGLSLAVGNFDTLSGDSTYQFWVRRDELWTPVGDFNTNSDGRWSGYFEFALERGDSIAITVEPEAGSEAPTTDAAIQSRI